MSLRFRHMPMKGSAASLPRFVFLFVDCEDRFRAFRKATKSIICCCASGGSDATSRAILAVFILTSFHSRIATDDKYISSRLFNQTDSPPLKGSRG
jgi:hypothetical protein